MPTTPSTTPSKTNQYCYIFNARQMGKSSLRVHATQRLQTQGTACGVLDISAIVEQGMTSDTFYLSILRRLSRSLGLKLKLRQWWKERDGLAPTQRFHEFIEDILLQHTQQPIVLFIDEIDSLFAFPFKDDFFSLLRSLHQERAEKPAYRRLSIVLIGVCTPSQLIADPKRTPFNVGTAIPLSGFTLDEAAPLIAGLQPVYDRPMALLNVILRWTQGQPFLTQKLCQLVAQQTNTALHHSPSAHVNAIVEKYVINDWLQHDTPEHLKTIQDRILSGSQAARLLEIYQKLLQSQSIISDNSPPQVELRLSGLVTTTQSQQLTIANPIYKRVFHRWWVEQEAMSLCPYSDAAEQWHNANGHPSHDLLLSGDDLEEALIWSCQRPLSKEHHQFLFASQQQQYEQKIDELQQTVAQTQSEAEQKGLIAQRLQARTQKKLHMSYGLLGLMALLVLFAALT